jgi:alpha-amylase/alpha-mannosidase (GH57 family)
MLGQQAHHNNGMIEAHQGHAPQPPAAPMKTEARPRLPLAHAPAGLPTTATRRGKSRRWRHGDGEFVLPWVYLHAMKDYVDMAAHLERHPQIHCVVNFVPVLLDQIEDYARQFASGSFAIPCCACWRRPTSAPSARPTQAAAGTCFRSNHTTMLAPFPHYKRLHDIYLLLGARGEAAYATCPAPTSPTS